MNKDECTKSRILLAAGPIFADKGFARSTVREICDAAEVNLASINYYFGDKKNLYVEAVIHARNMRAEQVPEPDWSDCDSPEQKLREYVSLMLNRVVVMKSAPWQVRLLLREILQPTDACRRLVTEYFRPFLDVLISIISELNGQRQMAEHEKMQMAFSIVGQCMFYRFAGDVTAMVIADDGLEDQFSVEHLTEHITTVSLSAIKNKLSESELRVHQTSPTSSGTSLQSQINEC